MTTAPPGEQGWGLPTPGSCVTGFSEVVEHATLLLPVAQQCRFNVAMIVIMHSQSDF
jgi:hypothetical protein